MDFANHFLIRKRKVVDDFGSKTGLPFARNARDVPSNDRVSP